jgi:hypothetical protein
VRAPLPAVRSDPRPTPLGTPTGGYKPVPRSIAARAQSPRAGEIPAGPQPDRRPARKPPKDGPITRPRPGPATDNRPVLLAVAVAAMTLAIAVLLAVVL